MKLREGPVENGGDVACNKVSDFVFGYDGGFLCRLDDGQRFSVSGELGRVFGSELEVDRDEVGDGFAARVGLDKF